MSKNTTAPRGVKLWNEAAESLFRSGIITGADADLLLQCARIPLIGSGWTPERIKGIRTASEAQGAVREALQFIESIRAED